jgi:hypothetical protein
MSTAMLIMWQPALYAVIIWGAALAWLVFAFWRGPRNWAAWWKPTWGWRTTAFYIVAGVFCLVFDAARTGFWWMGVCVLAAGVANAIGLLWWPGRLRHLPPR